MVLFLKIRNILHTAQQAEKLIRTYKIYTIQTNTNTFQRNPQSNHANFHTEDTVGRCVRGIQ